MKNINWAVLGTGVIANEMAVALKKNGKNIYAVGNRTHEKAVIFAEKYGIGKVYADYNEMFTDPDVDVIYITTPHNTHLNFMKKAIENGKHILVEKSITLNSDELNEALALAEEKVCTLLNIVLYALFNKLFGYTAANSWGNVLDNILCILFAYATNRAFVFRSRTQGREMAKEFGAFVTCRLGTLVLDAVIMMVGGNLLAAQGTALMEGLMQGVLGAVAGWINPATAVSTINTYAGGADRSAAIAIIGGADGPTAIFVSSYSAQTLWGLCVKVFSNVIVVVLNYVFSKLIIFKKKK